MPGISSDVKEKAR